MGYGVPGKFEYLFLFCLVMVNHYIADLITQKYGNDNYTTVRIQDKNSLFSTLGNLFETSCTFFFPENLVSASILFFLSICGDRIASDGLGSADGDGIQHPHRHPVFGFFYDLIYKVSRRL
jgi:hypothetical protein